MSRHVFLSAVWVFLFAATSAATSFAAEVSAYFSPRGGAAVAASTAIASAKSRVWVAAYAISQPMITRSIIAAHGRGLDVRLIIDRRQEGSSYSSAPTARLSGVPVFTDRHEKTFHHKYMVIDDQLTITGSFNFTQNAENSNAENLIIIRDAATNARFADDFTRHQSHSVPLVIHHRMDQFIRPLPPGLSPLSSPARK